MRVVTKPQTVPLEDQPIPANLERPSVKVEENPMSPEDKLLGIDRKPAPVFVLEYDPPTLEGLERVTISVDLVQLAAVEEIGTAILRGKMDEIKSELLQAIKLIRERKK